LAPAFLEACDERVAVRKHHERAAAFGVMFGVRKPMVRSTLGSAAGSISNPPEKSGPVAENVFLSRCL
jgi:hypothetical protein